jgi:uncharacterized protein
MTGTRSPRMARTSVPGIAERIAALDWPRIATDLDAYGCAVVQAVLSPLECVALAEIYAVDERFRSRIVMARHGFGRGEYKYFAHPLPDIVASLRGALYPPLARIANRWNAALGIEVRYPQEHMAFLERCHRAGQTRPTPLLLHYGEGDYNCLHQDLYGEHVFPLQATFLLSVPGQDFTGGEFVLMEQRPRQQSRAEVVPPAGARHARPLSRHPTPWREPGPLRPAPDARHHLPRCPMSRIRGAAIGEGEGNWREAGAKV